MNTITGIIITLNEAEHIADCIKSLLPVWNEIIVVDSGSQDQTREIAQSLNANYKKLDEDIDHYSFHNIGELFGKHSDQSYSTSSAKILCKKNRKANSFTPFLHGSWAFSMAIS